MKNDTAYYAVSSTKPVAATPSAPTAESVTGDTVTLTDLGDGFVYKVDDGEWQSSNVFTGLTPATEYKFYVKHIETTSYKESEASDALTVNTAAIYNIVFSTNYVTISKDNNTAGVGFGANDGYSNITKGSVSAGQSFTLISKAKVNPGVYDLNIYARSYTGRAPIDVEVNGTVVGESISPVTSAIGINTPFALNSITIPETTVITIKITATGKGSVYLNSLELIKTADYDADPLAVDVSMENGAAIRMNNVNGIRFYTKVDIDKISSLMKEDGVTVELGTLIAPKDLLGDAELTHKLDTDKFIDVKYTATNENGEYNYYTEESGFEGIVGSIANIKETANTFSENSGNVTRDFVGRGYVKVTKGDEVTYSYATYYNNDISNNARSLNTIATSVKADDTVYSGLSSTQKDLVDKWASAVK